MDAFAALQDSVAMTCYHADMLPSAGRRELYRSLVQDLEARDLSALTPDVTFEDLDCTEDRWNAFVARVRLMRGAAFAED